MADSPSVEHRLADERNVWLTTVRPDGRPHLTPVWFVYLDDRFWIGTGAQAVKTKNMAATPAVSLALEDGNAPVVAEGHATIHPTTRPSDVVTAFMQKYEWDITIDEDEDVGTVVLVEVIVTRWLFARPEGAS